MPAREGKVNIFFVNLVVIELDSNEEVFFFLMIRSELIVGRD